MSSSQQVMFRAAQNGHGREGVTGSRERQDRGEINTESWQGAGCLLPKVSESLDPEARHIAESRPTR